jgi:protein tyrosine/serine phosphatase
MFVSGTFNTRDVAHPPYLRPGLVYRSGTPSGLTPEGKECLANDLRVKTIFDLRSDGEKKALPLPSLEEEYGIQVVPLTSDTPPAAMDITDFVSTPENPDLWAGGSHGFSKEYLEILAIYKTAFRVALNHLITKPNSPMLFNCTAGKDRTGTLAALILSLVGVPDKDIAFDYSLSRIGIEPQKEFLTAFIRKWKPEWTEDTPGLREFSNVRKEYMLHFLQEARTVYGGDAGDEQGTWAERYARSELGFSQAEIETLRNNLR